jgi:hypothetical protein
MTLRVVKAVFRFVLWTVGFYIMKLPTILILLTGIFFTFYLIAHIEQDTTAITNVAFGIAASLSALCFSGARAISDSSKVADDLTYAGERFLHASILLLTAAVLKYALISLTSLGFTWREIADVEFEQRPVASMTLVIATVLIGLLFMQAISFTHSALTLLNRILWSRLTRRPDWDSMW